ncbi:MAG: hypothetical protein HY898_09915 [Deltaproteobacteria bacterium]|nr:hypothetical protein [Deltaproteobacteria bacterium]
MPMDNVDASVVLAPYLEPLVRGRRVVLLGDSSGTLAAGLIDRGARLVHVYDPDPVRAAESAARNASLRSLVVARLPEGDFGVRDGAFDAVIVPDLSCFSAPDEMVKQAGRLLAPAGTAIFAARNLEASHRPTGGSELTYYELYDTVSLQFPEVRMLGQAPFVGYVIADFAPEDEPDVTVDTSLLEHGAEEPLWFIALASRRPTRLDPYAIVQVPLAEATLSPRTAETPAVSSQELEQARTRITSLEADLDAERVAAKDSRARAIDPAVVQQLQEQIKQAQEQIKQTEARAGDAHVRAGRLDGKVRDLEEELRHQRERAFKLSRELDDEKKYRTKAELELGMMRRGSELPPKPVEVPVDVERIEKLEAELGASMHKLARVERELGEARGRVTQLEESLAQANDDLQDARAVKTQLEQRVRELQAGIDERDARIAQFDATAIEAAERAAERSRDEELREALQERDEVTALMAQARSEHETEVTHLEQKLVERGREIDSLRREVAHRDQLVRELVAIQAQPPAVEAPGEQPVADGESIAALRGQLDRLAAESARREAQLQAANWRVQELENTLAEAQRPDSGSTAVAELERALFAAQSELDALRRSLQQEHAARGRLEQGGPGAEGLAEAQAQIQQQAVLAASVHAAESNTPGSVDR